MQLVIKITVKISKAQVDGRPSSLLIDEGGGENIHTLNVLKSAHRLYSVQIMDNGSVVSWKRRAL